VSQYTSGGCRCEPCKEAKRLSARQYYEKKHDERVEYSRNYRQENHDKFIESHRKTYYKHRQKNIDYSVKWARENRDKQRTYERVTRLRRRAANGIKYTAAQLAERFAYYGNKCYLQLPGCTGGAEHADHVKPLSKGGWDMLGNIRPACAPCNRTKSNHWPFIGCMVI
jgi:hypothetical protein